MVFFSSATPGEGLMNPDELFHRYQELQHYVGWTEEDAHRVQSVASLLNPYLPALIDDFYEEIERHPDARKVITGGPQQIDRLKGTVAALAPGTRTGPYDKDYVMPPLDGGTAARRNRPEPGLIPMWRCRGLRRG